MDISQNEIAGKLDVGNCSNLKVLICRNNYLNSLRAHINLFNNNTLANQKDNLQPQQHNSDKVHWKNDIYWNTPLESQEERTATSNAESSQSFSQDWRNIHSNFTNELQQEWESRGFTYEQTQEWISVGLQPATDFDYAQWLKNIEKKDADWVLNYGSEESLREQYREFRISGGSRHNSQIQLSWKEFYKWVQKEIIAQGDGERVKLKAEQQANYPNLTENALNRFVDSCEATLDRDNSFHLFPAYANNKTFEELFDFDTVFCGKKTNKKKIGGASYNGLKKLFCDWKKTLSFSPENSPSSLGAKEVSSLSENKAKGSKSTSEFINHLKTLYENCSVYFDIQEKMIVVKNQRTKAEREEEFKYTDEFKRMRIRYQELRSVGRKDLPELPATTEECYSDRAYQPEETRFQWLITKLDEWETNQNKKVEKVSSLVEFLEWTVSEEERLAKKAHAKEVGENFLALVNQFHEYQEQYSQMSEEEREFHDKKESLLSQLDYQQLELANHQSQIQELTAELPHLKKPKSIDLNNSMISKTKEITVLIEKEIKNILTGLKRLELEQRIAELKKERNKLLAKEAGHYQEVKNILLIGRAGSGKSTLGNVLVNKNGQFEEIFKESAGSVSETKEIKTEKFTLDISLDGTEQIHYLVIDTAGFGDTQLSEKEILQLLKGLVPIIKENGISQIFLVNNGRFKKEEIDTYKLLENVLFDQNAGNYTTIVRTKFPSFENHVVCEADKQQLQVENSEIARILQRSKIIYVDNPPLEGNPRVIEVNQETREISRKRLLTYLGTCLDSYKSSNLEDLNNRINEYMSQEEKLNKEITDKEQKICERETELQKEVESIQQQKVRDLRITVRNFERQVQELQEQNTKKVQTTQQEIEEVNREQLRQSQEAYNQSLNQINSDCQSSLSQIRNSFNSIEVGKPVCRYGHDNSIQTYNKAGSLVPNYQSDFIGYIYCPTCGTNDYNFTLRNATTYTLEEWSRKYAEQARERTRRMEEAIREQEQQKQNMINRIRQLRNEQEAAFRRELDSQRENDELLLEKQRLEREIRLKKQRQDLESQINSNANSRETSLRNQSGQQIQDLNAHIQQARQGINNAQRTFFGWLKK